MATKIEWAQETWNPITGCTKISEGCKNCYAERLARRLAGRYGYPKDDPFKVTFHPDRLEQPIHWKKPRMIFVCSMGDLFHPDVSNWMIDMVFTAMTHPLAGGNHHIYLLLTKRPQRILTGHSERFKDWPNIWLGVTAENQKRADERIPILLQIPAAVHFVSIEPMLGPVDLEVVPCRSCNHPGDILAWPCPYCKARRFEWPDWIICGGESGPGARPMHPDWARSLRDQCITAGVPFLFKQWGEYVESIPVDIESAKSHLMVDHGTYYRLGKKKAGRLLDGRMWEQYPKCREI